MSEAPAFLVFAAEQEFVHGYGITRYSPRIDFLRNFLVVVHGGACPSGGYRVFIEGLVCDGRHGTVRVRSMEPGPGEVVTLGVTCPQDTVLVAKQARCRRWQVHFSFVDARGNHRARTSVNTG